MMLKISNTGTLVQYTQSFLLVISRVININSPNEKIANCEKKIDALQAKMCSSGSSKLLEDLKILGVLCQWR